MPAAGQRIDGTRFEKADKRYYSTEKRVLLMPKAMKHAAEFAKLLLEENEQVNFNKTILMPIHAWVARF